MSDKFKWRYFFGGTGTEFLTAWYLMVALGMSGHHVGYWTVLLFVMAATSILSLGVVGGLYTLHQWNKD